LSESTDPRVLKLGDMAVVGEHPGKMVKALAVVASELHSAYDAFHDCPKPGGSKEACLFSSLAVRDFLVEIGFKDATVRSVACVVRATRHEGEEIHSVGVGVPFQTQRDEKFNGHAVVTVPSLYLMIDTTLYPWDRPAWNGGLPGMMALSYHAPDPSLKLYGCDAIAGMTISSDDRRIDMIWIDRPEVNWKREIDFRVRSPRRAAVTKALVEGFGIWND
jgi:hypothetical protein